MTWNFKEHPVDGQKWPVNKVKETILSKSNYHSYNNSYHQDRSEGVLIRFTDGSTFTTKELTVKELNDAIEDAVHGEDGNWLYLKGGGAINLTQIIRYQPFNFEKRKRHEPKPRYDNYRNNRYRRESSENDNWSEIKY
ncbi:MULTISPECIES: hypothetical protein [Lactobacillus]|uniref:Uncharacterized protein n=1 Tax=Lactobacillus xujianguonis TaxID=2495899 RepID=A0A437SSY8_9LACO|nr:MULTISPECIES: hypothetical protein [Lactobacillus]RVU70033.1 hypothetical protein EJK17_09900 [Lactobacillus xujianguonis]RVU73437.1 hypothetical protein EJK20_08085 [Lactobacillus xujianguonis]